MRIATKFSMIPASLKGIIRAPNAATSNDALVEEYKQTAKGVGDAVKALLVALLRHRRSTLRLAMRLEQIKQVKAPALKTRHAGVAETLNLQVTHMLASALNYTAAYVRSTSHDMAEMTNDRTTRKLVKAVSEIKEITTP